MTEHLVTYGLPFLVLAGFTIAHDWRSFAHKKVGGIRFIRFGRIRVSFCIAKRESLA